MAIDIQPTLRACLLPGEEEERVGQTSAVQISLTS